MIFSSNVRYTLFLVHEIRIIFLNVKIIFFSLFFHLYFIISAYLYKSTRKKCIKIKKFKFSNFLLCFFFELKNLYKVMSGNYFSK